MKILALVVCVAVTTATLQALQTTALAADAEPDEQVKAGARELVDGMPVVRLSTSLQARSGIVTQVLEAVTQHDESVAYAEAVDLQPLLEARARYHQALAQQRIDAAALEASRQDYQRLLKLREQQHYVSEQDLGAARARSESDQARVDGGGAQLADLRAQLQQSWGAALTRWALDGGSEIFDRLVQREELLLLVSLRAGDSLPAQADTITVGRQGQRVQATLVSAAPRTDPAFQGETWYFRAPAGSLRTGMRTDAAIPAGDAGVTGVNLPADALVWQGGKPWVYEQLDAERFVRRALPVYRDHGDTWFVSDALQAGARVVVTGAQMLLSEEFRWQIPEERDDD